MKNKAYRFLFILLFIIQGTTLTSQTAIDQYYLGLRIGPPVFLTPYLYISGNDNFISIRKKSGFKFSFDKRIKSQSSDFTSRYFNPIWNGSVSNFNLGYSPVKHLYGTASLMLVNENERSGLYHSKMVLSDIGIGGYLLKETENIFKKKNIFNKDRKMMLSHKGILVNALLGYSRGNITHEAYDKIGLATLNLNRFYGKIGLDYQARFWGFAGNLRLGVLNYSSTTINGHAYADLSEQIETLMNQNNFTFSELSIRFYLGLKYGQVYISYINSTTDTKLDDFRITKTGNVGVLLDLQELFKKKVKNDD